jgi:hypothetical protein
VTEKFGVQEDDTLPFDIFITAMSGGAAIGAASAPTTGAFGGIGAFATLMGLLTAEDGVDYDLLASDYLSQVISCISLKIQDGLAKLISHAVV